MRGFDPRPPDARVFLGLRAVACCRLRQAYGAAGRARARLASRNENPGFCNRKTAVTPRQAKHFEHEHEQEYGALTTINCAILLYGNSRVVYACLFFD